MERVKGIEPSYAAWEAAVLPLNYTRAREHALKALLRYAQHSPAMALNAERIKYCNGKNCQAGHLVIDLLNT